MPSEIAALPWASVLFFVSGYLGYFIANAGTRDHHQQIDVIFSTAVYGFFSIFAYQIALHAGWSMLVASIPAIITGVTLGIFWTVFGRGWSEKLLHVTNVTHNNDTPTAWMQILRTRGISMQQVTITLKNGWQFHCEDLYRFRQAPNGPCCFGAKGDVLIYATHRRPKIGDPWEKMEYVEGVEGWGPIASWFAADEISAVDIGRITA